MISLKPPAEPFEIKPLPGIVFTVTPLTTLDMAIAQSAAKRRLDELEDSQGVCWEAGLLPKGRVIDLADENVRDGLFHQFLIDELGVRHITAFKEGIEDEAGSPKPATPETIRAVLACFPVGQNFYRDFTAKHRELLAAKKDSGIAPAGTSGPAAVPPTATTAD